MKQRKIVLGCDPGHEMAAVTALGHRLSILLHAAPVLASVLPWPHYLVGPEQLDPDLIKDLESLLEAAAEDLAITGAETRVISGPTAAESLDQLALAEHARLIVVGSSHHGRLGRTLGGSVGESLLHGASTAVAVAPRGYREPEAGIERVAVGFDGSAEAWSALETAIGLAERASASIAVISVAEGQRYGYASPWSAGAVAEIREAAHAEAERLSRLACGRAPAGVDCETRLLEGTAGASLAAVSPDFDLIVAGSRSWGPLRRTLLGSTTRTLIADSRCPVLVLPRGAGVDPLAIDHGRRRNRPASAVTT